MISVEDFLEVLREKDIVPAGILGRLRAQVSQSPEPIPATALAKQLVDRGYLTRPLAKRLLEAAAQQEKSIAADETSDSDLELEEPLQIDETPDQRNLVDDNFALKSIGNNSVKPLITSVTPLSAKPLGSDVVEGELVNDARSFNLFSLKRLKRLLKKLRPKHSRRRRANVWDSSLLLVGGGALAILVILAFAFGWVFWGASADAVLAEADSSYKAGAYHTAISKYDEFLREFPDHQEASLARVRCGVAIMRNATEGTTDYARSLDVAVEVLNKIGSENSFGEARNELRSLLPTIAEGLSQQAHKQTNAEYVAKTRQALALVEKYVSKSHRPATRLDDIKSLLAMTEKRIARDDELAKATTAMQTAIDEGKTSQAYAIRRGLLKRYPDLLGNKQLRLAVLAVAKAEKKAVKFVDVAKKSYEEDLSDDNEAAACLAVRKLKKSVPGAAGGYVFVVVQGAAYALDVADGKVLWRRQVGFDQSPQRPAFPPMHVSRPLSSDALLADARTQSLLRLDAATGQLRWRQTIDEPFVARPVIDGKRLLLAAGSGRLIFIELESGNSPGYVQLPQKLSTRPLVDQQRKRIYQVADHSNLYILAADGKCEDVVYVGHESGAISAPPVIINKYLVLAENRGSNSVVLLVMSLEEYDKTPGSFFLQEIPLEGRVDTQPVVSGTSMLVTTDTGRVYALRVSRTDVINPLEKVGQLQTSATENLVRYSLLVDKQFWVADDHLTKYEIQASLGTLKNQWSTCKDSVFLQSPMTVGGNIFSVRRRIGMPGVIASVIGMNRPDTFWQTHLAVGPVALPTVSPDGKTLTVVTKLGSVFELDTARLKSQGRLMLEQPLVSLAMHDLTQPVNTVECMPDGMLVLSTGRGSEQLEVFDPVAMPKKFRPLILPEPLAARPVSFADGLLVPGSGGRIFVLDPRGGVNLVEPFQPTLGAGERPHWRSPIDLGDGSLLISDGREMIYRLGVKQSPKPHLAALNKVRLDADVASPLAVVGNIAFIVDEHDRLRSLTLPTLAPADEPLTIGGRCIWGPYAVGNRLFLANDDDKLICYDAAGQRQWQIGLIHGCPIGHPLAVDDGFIFTSLEGVVWRVATSNGAELAKIETGLFLATGPVLLDGQLLFCGHDGSLYIVDPPE